MFPQNDCIPMVCKPIHEELLKSVKNNKTDNIRNLINTDPNLLSYKYPDINKRILEAACGKDFSDTVTVDTINLLIVLGADLEDGNASYNGMKVIHFAAESMNVDILTAILKAMETKQINLNLITDDGDTALLHLLKWCDNYEHKYFLQCIKLLASKVDVNCTDNRGAPAIYIAATKGLKNVADILRIYNLDVDSFKNIKGETTRQLIVKRQWYPSEDLPVYIHSDDDVLLQKIYSKKLTDSDLNDLEDLNKEYCSGTLLQTLIQCGRVDLVKKLMVNPEKVNWNQITNRNPVLPIYIALERGDYETLDVLIRFAQVVPVFKSYHLNFEQTTATTVHTTGIARVILFQYSNNFLHMFGSSICK